MNTKVKTKMKSKTEILNLLKQYKPKAQREYGLTRLGIFGSVARDEQTGDSDVGAMGSGTFAPTSQRAWLHGNTATVTV